MLGWFSRHQKSLMLVLLAPALIAMGITGAIMSVLTNPGDMQAGKLFGEEITQPEFDKIRRLYQGTARGAGDEQAWRFLALYTAARRAGLHVAEAEVGKDIMDTMRWSVAQLRAMKELEAQNVDITTQEGRQQFNTLVMEYIANPPPFDPKEYEEVVKRRGLSVQEFETQQVREALVQRYLETLRELAVIDEDAVWDEYQDKHQLRALDLVEVRAQDHLPDLAAADGAPGYVSADQVQVYYELHAADYDEPRRVELEWIAFPFADAEEEVPAPERAQLEEFNRREGIADVNSFDAHEDAIREAFYKDAARKRVAQVMDAVADKVQAAEDEKQGVDLKAIAAAVRSELSSDALLDGTTGLITEEGLDDDDGLLNNWPAQRWFRVSPPGQVSDVLGGTRAWFVLRTKTVERERTPPFPEIEARVRQDYAQGSSQELDEEYEAFQNTRYRRELSWQLQAVVADDADFGGDHAKAREAITKAYELAKDYPRDKALKSVELEPGVDAKVRHLELEPLDKAALEAHPALGKLAAEVSTATRGKVQPVAERGDGKGWVLWRLVRRMAASARPFAEVEAQVREDVRLKRGLTRAEKAAEELLGQLRHKTGEALTQKLTELKLEATRTEAFARDAVTLEGVTDAGKLVAEGFSAEAVVDGPYVRSVVDVDGNRVFLVRVAAKEDAPKDGFAESYASLRKDLLSKHRMDFAERQVRELTLEAKGISPGHLEFAARVRDGANGASKLTIRQIFLAPDRTIIEGWLDEAAKGRLGEAEAALAGGTAWEVVVDRFSEDDVTRARAGELPAASRGELAPDFGADFEEVVFGLQLNAQPRSVKSLKGWHLVRLKELQGAKRVVQHLLVRTDRKMRKLPQEIQDKAENASKTTMEKALADLAAGRPFGLVAEEYGDPNDAFGQGQELELDYVSHLERAALNEFLEWELPDGHPEEDNLQWAPALVQLPASAGPAAGWQLFACARDPNDQGAAWEVRARRDRRVYHIQSQDKGKLEEVREELVEFLTSDEDGDRHPWTRILERFEELATEYSEAPSKEKGGALGLVRLKDAVRAYGDEFLKRIAYREDGTPVQAGTRTGLFRGDEGYHIVEITQVESAEGPLAGDASAELTEKRRDEVAALLIEGTGWR